MPLQSWDVEGFKFQISTRTLSDPTAVSVAVLINDRIKTPVKHSIPRFI
jgi:hypothetical protein